MSNEKYRVPMIDKIEPTPVEVERGKLHVGHKHGDELIVVKGKQQGTYSDAATAFCAWRKSVGIDWTYTLRPAPHPSIPGAFVPNRNWISTEEFEAAGNPKCWGPFSDGYGLTQLDTLDTLAGVIMREGCKVRSTLVQDMGGSVAITAERQASHQVGPRGEKIESLFTIVDSVDGSYSIRAGDHAHDVVCRNTLSHAVFGGQRTWKLRHTKDVADKVASLALAVAQGGGYAEAVVKRLFAYDQTEIDLDKVVTFMRRLRKVEEAKISAKAKANRERLVERDVEIYQNAPAAAAGTFYGVHQWATFTATHLLGSKAIREDEGRLVEYTVLGKGQTWQDEVVGQIDSWWQESASTKVLQTVSLLR